MAKQRELLSSESREVESARARISLEKEALTKLEQEVAMRGGALRKSLSTKDFSVAVQESVVRATEAVAEASKSNTNDRPTESLVDSTKRPIQEMESLNDRLREKAFSLGTEAVQAKTNVLTS